MRKFTLRFAFRNEQDAAGALVIEAPHERAARAEAKQRLTTMYGSNGVGMEDINRQVVPRVFAVTED